MAGSWCWWWYTGGKRHPDYRLQSLVAHAAPPPLGGDRLPGFQAVDIQQGINQALQAIKSSVLRIGADVRGNKEITERQEQTLSSLAAQVQGLQQELQKLV